MWQRTFSRLTGSTNTGRWFLRKQLRQREVLTFFASLPPCLIGIEACSASHYWARELTALGHQVRMMPARYVKPYVQRGKSDALMPRHLRGREPSDNALCGDQIGRAAIGSHAPPRPGNPR